MRWNSRKISILVSSPDQVFSKGRAKGVHKKSNLRQKPTIPPIPLPHILHRRPIDKELRLVKDISHPLYGPRLERRRIIIGPVRLGVAPVIVDLGRRRRALVAQRLEAIALAALEVVLEIEVRIAVLAIDGATLVGDLADFGAADLGGLGVRGLRCPLRALGGALGGLFGVFILGYDSGCFFLMS